VSFVKSSVYGEPKAHVRQATKSLHFIAPLCRATKWSDKVERFVAGLTWT